jgi:hypothetical protein
LNILGSCSRGDKMPSMAVPSEYVLEPLLEGTDFTLYRAKNAATKRQPWLWHAPMNSRRLKVSGSSNKNTRSQ